RPAPGLVRRERVQFPLLGADGAQGLAVRVPRGLRGAELPQERERRLVLCRGPEVAGGLGLVRPGDGHQLLSAPRRHAVSGQLRGWLGRADATTDVPVPPGKYVYLQPAGRSAAFL